MNEMLELWSLPWHALQRHLAASCGVDGAAPATAQAPQARAGGPAAMAAAHTHWGAGMRGASWLARARLNGRPGTRRGF